MTEPGTEADTVARAIVDAAFKVHSALGPGLLESAYEQCLAHELALRRLAVERQVPVPVGYRGLQLETGFRLDMVVGGVVVIEVKAIERTLPVHEDQLLTYLRFSGHRIGLLINFNVPLIKHGIRRFVRSG